MQLDTRAWQRVFAATAVAVGIAAPVAIGGGSDDYTTQYGPMVVGDSAASDAGWSVTPIFTVGETVDGFTPAGILDGTGAYRIGKTVRVLVNSELNDNTGYEYELANGLDLTGSRVTYFDIDAHTRQLCGAGLAYDTIRDRAGNVVTSASQLNEGADVNNGIARLCSAQLVEKGQLGFADDIFFTGEENGNGMLYALDVAGRELWAVPAVGRAAFESVTPVATPNGGTIGLIIGDDQQSAPLYLYLGQKNANGDGSFLDRNGLAVGTLYAWAADNGDLDPEDWNGSGSRDGTFYPLTTRNVAMAGLSGYDAAGWADDDTLRAEADGLGCFSFSRPEDVHTNPRNGRHVIFASTGRGGLFPSDNWGTIYRIELSMKNNQPPKAEFTIVYDTDALLVPDAGIRSPDNLVWAFDGQAYVQEDRSTSPGSLFGGVTGAEASIWQLHPYTGHATRIAEIDRSAVAPAGTTDPSPNDIGNWETSGVIDVTRLFQTTGGERLLLATVQAHSLSNGPIGGSANLVQGGQIVLLSASGNQGNSGN